MQGIERERGREGEREGERERERETRRGFLYTCCIFRSSFSPLESKGSSLMRARAHEKLGVFTLGSKAARGLSYPAALTQMAEKRRKEVVGILLHIWGKKCHWILLALSLCLSRRGARSLYGVLILFGSLRIGVVYRHIKPFFLCSYVSYKFY